MFGSLGGAEILLVMVLALLLFGPRKLPEIGKTMGRALSEFRKATHDLKMNLEQEVATEELREARKSIEAVGSEVKRSLAEVNPAALARGSLTAPAPAPDRPAPAPAVGDSESPRPAVRDRETTPPAPEPDDRQNGQP